MAESGPGTGGTDAAALTAEVARLFQDLPFIGMAVTSPASKRWLQVNQTLCDLLGYPRDELLARTWAELTHPDDLDLDTAEFDRVLRDESDGYKLDKRFLRKDGAVVHATIDVKAVRRPDRSIDFFVATVADIGPRVRAEAAAREAAALLTDLAQQIPGAVYQFQHVRGGRQRIPFATAGLLDLHGLGPDTAVDDLGALYERIHPDDRGWLATAARVSLRELTPLRCDYRVLHPERGLRWLSCHARPARLSERVTLWHGYITDVTERELDRLALAESEQRYRSLVEHAPEAIVVYDAEAGRFLDVNPAAERLFGLARPALCARSVAAVSPPLQPDGQPSATLAAAWLARALAGDVPVFEWQHVHADGSRIPCEVRLSRITALGRQLVRGTLTDLRERHQVHTTLRRLRAAIDSSVSGVALADDDGRLTYVNRAFLELWGHADAGEVLGRHLRELWREPERVTAFLAGLRQRPWSGEVVARRADGAERTFQIAASVIRDEAGRPSGMLGSFVDVTEARALEARLVQSQKLESLGRLAGGIAHDFNNLLTVIKGYVTVALDLVPTADPLRADLGEIERAADAAAALTRQLLALSRRQVIAPIVLDLNEVVHRVSGLLQRVLGEDIELVVTTSIAPCMVRFDPGQAEQILINLAVNARDAMPDGGRLTISATRIVIDDEAGRGLPGIALGPHVRLTVADTGVGMSEEIRRHAFEPFYTTKAAGQGTGLGLAVIHGVVSQNGGRIEVSSSPGQGARFDIYLPCTTGRPERAPSALALAPGGRETILLVEDDAAVRGLAERLLRQLGYQVHAFDGGPAALVWLARGEAVVDLLLTDVVMPGMNGKQLAERVVALSPTTKVLFVSGYTASVIEQQGVLEAGVQFLAKPYTLADLAARLRALLDPPGARPRLG